MQEKLNRKNGIQEKKSEGEKLRREQTEHDVSRGTHHVINPSRPSPAFRTASDKSWAWRPEKEATATTHSSVNYYKLYKQNYKLNW